MRSFEEIFQRIVCREVASNLYIYFFGGVS